MVTGATGRTGSQIYQGLKKTAGVDEVRALVRNVTQARDVLGCLKCDESEGIYVGDVTDINTLYKPFTGVDVLVIAVGTPEPTCHPGVCPAVNCTYPPGAAPKDVLLVGSINQINAFANVSGVDVPNKLVLMISTTLTTVPDNLFDKMWGHSFMYHLNGEAILMDSGLPFFIAKACSLADGPGNAHKLLVGHNDQGINAAVSHSVDRIDLSNVLVYAVANPAFTKNLRFDLCSNPVEKPSGDLTSLMKEAMHDWDPRKNL